MAKLMHVKSKEHLRQCCKDKSGAKGGNLKNHFVSSGKPCEKIRFFII